MVSEDRIPASSTTRPVSAGNFGAAQTFSPKKAGVTITRNASKAAASRIRYGFGTEPGWAAAGAGGGAVLLAPGKLTTGADCAAVKGAAHRKLGATIRPALMVFRLILAIKFAPI